MEDIYKYMQWGNYDAVMSSLAAMAIPEKWDVEGKGAKYILKNYMAYTFDRLKTENKVIETDKECVFNTGLYTKYYEEIYVYGQVVDPYGKDKYGFIDFCTQYKLGKYDVRVLPERADYFQNPELLIFDWHCPVRVQYDHILDDERNKKRLPDDIINSKTALQTLRGCIDLSIKRTIANYKLAVPQYYNGKIQLLLPLYFGNDDSPDLALVLSRTDDGFYLGHTCLTLEMAYMNARLIAKPESNWLML